jgi:nucleoid DNA-binding protein
MTKKFEKSLVHVLREQLLNSRTVQFDGIGSFRVEHRKQTTVRNESGKTVLMPPKDVLIFSREGS